ncbi:MAG: S8 family peptidase, partial [Planctomycetota bacterium]
MAVLDTGIDYKHPDLDDNCYGGVNVINPRKDYRDDNGHGTHVAGIIAAEDNDIGVVGVAPEAYLYGVKALDRNGSGWLSDIIAGLEWCVNNRMDIVNMSLGADSDIQAFHDACDAASATVILVAAAGNDGGAVDYPAAYGSVIAVSATDSSDGLASFSNYGNEIEIAAPGVNILSTYKGGGYETHSGTSMAAPHVA